ncbi:hypothetical protein FRB91_005905 [Serendipita sp. 411]|nr:hypothetical protein FRB91_005905 [Serendipita sp. 411]
MGPTYFPPSGYSLPSGKKISASKSIDGDDDTRSERPVIARAQLVSDSEALFIPLFLFSHNLGLQFDILFVFVGKPTNRQSPTLALVLVLVLSFSLSMLVQPLSISQLTRPHSQPVPDRIPRLISHHAGFFVFQLLTFAPPCLFGGSVTFTVSNRGFRSTPNSSAVNFSIGFFFAFMMLGKDVYRGSGRIANS